MTLPPAVSVIVVSRGRPARLTLCLTAIGQLWYPRFEVVVVADPAGCAAVRDLGWEGRVKLVAFDEANISAARNLGIAEAAGEILAFIDDDAVPEPSWLDHLCAPFADPEVVQTGGFLRGRNGISLQWPARVVNALGETRVVETPGEAPFTPACGPGEAVKTEGANMALRRDVIAGIGGFDPAFAFYLDETDVNLRLKGRRSVLVPLAQVHHGYAGSDRRLANRAVTDLTQVGASTMVFLRKHAPEDMHDARRNKFREEQRKRLIGQMVDGLLSPDRIAPLMTTLEQGVRLGRARPLAPCPSLPAPAHPFLAFDGAMTGRSRFFAGRPWSRRRLAARARAAVAGGDVATVLRLSPTALAHRAAFHPSGYWEQWGGLFGRRARSGRWFTWTGFAARVQQERAKLSKLRRI